MKQLVIPDWIKALDQEDLNFIKRFVLSSGSLKQMATQYNVTYPTMRLRLNRLIDKIKVNDHLEDLPYVKLIKQLAIEEKIDYDTAKILVNAYKEERSE